MPSLSTDVGIVVLPVVEGWVVETVPLSLGLMQSQSLVLEVGVVGLPRLGFTLVGLVLGFKSKT